MPMQTIFNRIYAQFERLKQHSQSDIDLSFNDGATDDDFAKLEQVLGFELPKEFKDIYRIHNGSANQGNFVDYEWLSIQRIIEFYQVWLEWYQSGEFNENGLDFGCEPTSTAIKEQYWWNPRWIVITDNQCFDGKMIDLDPSETGTKGQIIQMWHDDPSRELLAVSLTDFFEQFATDLENDKYLIHPKHHFIKRDTLKYLEAK